MSEHKSLAEALAAFQGDAPKLHKGNTAEVVSKRTGSKYSYKYVDLADVVEAVQPILVKHGLSFSAFPCVGPDSKPALRYTLRHTGGDVESEVMPLMLASEDAQAFGSAITYGRRYAFCAVLNIVADADDDGAAAKAAEEKRRQEQPKNGADSYVTSDDIRTLAHAAHGLTAAQIRRAIGDVGASYPDPKDATAGIFDLVPQSKAAQLVEVLAQVPGVQ